MLEEALEYATQAVVEAGGLLRKEFYRPGGPRGEDGHALVDEEVERLLRGRLEAKFPGHGIVGEELFERNRHAQEPESFVWLIDPNDGTSAFLRGWRGAAVSVALLRGGVPVLGVVYAYAARAGRGDLITWAEGCPLMRNGSVVDLTRTPMEPIALAISQAADRASAINADLCAPYRFLAVPSIAYRLALVAVGEAEWGLSIAGPTSWDFAGGHALLRACGYDVWGNDPSNHSITYDPQTGHETDAVGDCMGGNPEGLDALLDRDWNRVFDQPRNELPKGALPLCFPDPRCLVHDADLLDRAQGVLLGQLAGDNLGSLVEFQHPEEIAGVSLEELRDGGVWDLIAGQPTDDSELALSLARSIVHTGRYDPADAIQRYVYWYRSNPFDIGETTANALDAASGAEDAAAMQQAAQDAARRMNASKSNGALMRVSPLGIWGYRLLQDELAAFARADARLTHANPVCQDANAVFVLAIADLLRGATPATAYANVLQWAKANAEPLVYETLVLAQEQKPSDYLTQMGYVRIALQNAFFHLLHTGDPATAIRETIRQGGDTDTNAAIVGALLGARDGGQAFPVQWRHALLTCRPIGPQVQNPRPESFWPVDAEILAERLLCREIKE